MKKSLIALAVAGAMTAPIVAQADATLYGGVETRLKFVEDHDASLFVDKAEIGVKGSTELENLDGVKATYQIEFRLHADTDADSDDEDATSAYVNNDVRMRKANVGLTGGFGSVIVGRQNNLADAAEGYTDIVMSYGSYFDSDRIGNAISYVTPNMAGFEAYVQLIADGAEDDVEEDVDGYVVGFNYSIMDLDLSVGYTEISGNYFDGVGVDSGASDEDLLSVGAGYSIGDLSLGLTYEQADDGTDEDELYAVAATYAIGNAKLKGVFAQYDLESGSDADEYGVQAEYALGKKAGVKASYVVYDEDAASSSEDTVTLSYYVNF